MTKLSTLIQNPLFCSVPWVHTEIDVPANTIRTCPMGKFTMGNFLDGVPVVWANSKYAQLRQNFLENIESDNCVVCTSGGNTRTFRGEKNKSFYIRRMLNSESTEIVGPKSVTVKISSLSNIAPRYSFFNNSSIINDFVSNSSVLQKYLNATSNSIPSIESFRGSFIDAQSVTIEAGETFMFPGIVDLIDLIVEESNGKLKQLILTTHLNYKNQLLLDKLDQISKNVAILFHLYIDGPKSIYEYIRHGASYDILLENLTDISNRYRQFKFNAVFGLSILNIGYVPEILETINSIQNVGVKFVETIWFTDNSTFLNPSNITYGIKQEYLNKLASYDYSNNTIPELRTIILMTKHILTSPPRNSMEGFYEFINAFDECAGTDYKTLYPELAVGAPSGN